MVYTLALYGLDAGKIDPWEVLLYVWVIVSGGLFVGGVVNW